MANVAEAGGGNAVVSTSRTLVTGVDGDDSLRIAREVPDAVVTVVRKVLDIAPPRFVIAKGGITSSDVASRGLEIGRAIVCGPMLPGIVSLWEPIMGLPKVFPISCSPAMWVAISPSPTSSTSCRSSPLFTPVAV